MTATQYYNAIFARARLSDVASVPEEFFERQLKWCLLRRKTRADGGAIGKTAQTRILEIVKKSAENSNELKASIDEIKRQLDEVMKALAKK